MISCYELRMGNFVMINETFQRVSSVSRKSVFTGDADESDEPASVEYSLEKVEPVKLTDDILKECGFVYHDYFKFWQLFITGKRSEMDIDLDYDLIDFMRKPIIKNITSLHQLQNAYFVLKGKELELTKEQFETVLSPS